MLFLFLRADDIYVLMKRDELFFFKHIEEHLIEILKSFFFKLYDRIIHSMCIQYLEHLK